MKFLKWIFRHRYRIDKVKDSDFSTGRVRFVVREKSWWHLIGMYMCIRGVSSFDTYEEALAAIEKDKNREPLQKKRFIGIKPKSS